MPDRSQWWLNRVGDAAAATSSRTSPQPDYTLARDIGQAPLTSSEYSDVVDHMMTMADDQDEAALQMRAADLLAQGRREEAARLLQEHEEDGAPWWKKAIGAVGDAFGAAGRWAEDTASGVVDLLEKEVITPARENLPGVDEALNVAETATGAAGEALDPVGEGLQTVGEGLEATYNTVDRVIATPFIASTLAGTSFEAMFRADTWSEAWELGGEPLTAGQALADFFAGDADEVASWYREGFDETGMPRNQAYAELRENSLWYNSLSGSLDFVKAWFADPLVVAGKAGGAARAHIRGDFHNLGRGSQEKIRNIVLATDDQIARMPKRKWDVVGNNALRLRERMLNLRDEVRDGMRDTTSLVEGEFAFADSPDAAALFVQASKARKFDPETGRIGKDYDDDLFRDFVGASMGDGDATARLTSYGDTGSELATAIANMREVKLKSLNRLADESAREHDRLVRDTSIPAAERYARAMNAEQTFYDTMREADELRGVLERYESRLDFIHRAQQRSLDQVRAVPGAGRTLVGQGFDVATEVHRPVGLNGASETYTKVPMSAFRKRPGLIDLHRPGQAYEAVNRYFDSMVQYGDPRAFDAVLVEEGYTSFEQARRSMLNRAASATTDTERLAVAEAMEDLGFRVVAAKYDIEPDLARQILGAVKGRRANLFESVIAKHGEDAQRISFVEDGTRHTVEMTATQLKNNYFAVDLRAVDGILKQHGLAMRDGLRAEIARGGHRLNERVSNFLDSYNKFWKPMVLFRLGYTPRTVSDDFIRAFSMVNNAADMLLRTPQAVAIGTANMVPRTINMVRAPFRSMAQRRWDERNTDIAAESVSDLADIDQARLKAIQQRTEGVERAAYEEWHARANGATVPKNSKPEVVRKLERLLERTDDNFAVDLASGKKLPANRDYYDFGLSRARTYSDKPSAMELARYARENADRLSHPDGVLAVQRVADGWRVTVARKGPGARKLATLKQRSMSKGVTVGAQQFSAPAEPGVADNYTFLVSSDTTWKSLMRADEANVSQMRAAMIQQGRSTTQKDGIRHAENWANTVNKLFVQDPVVRRILEIGPDETVRWLRNTSDGREAARRLHINNPEKYTDNVANQLNALLPDEALRARVMRGEELRPEELMARMRSNPESVPSSVDGPAVELATRTGEWGQRMNNLTDKIYNVLATIPTDTLVRQPFFRSQYQSRLQGMLDTLDPKRLDKDGNIPPSVREAMEKSAREWGLKQTRRYMFSLADNTDLVHTMRFLMPFMGAWQETMIRWATISMERPHQMWRIWGQGWQNMEESFFLDMVDEQGRSADDPEHGELTNIRMPVPKWFTKNVLSKFIGKDAAELVHSVNVNKEGLNAILQGSPWWLPGGGPVLQFPAKALLGNKPHLKDENAFTAFMYKYLFPTGVPDNIDAILPAGWMQEAVRFAQGTDSPQFRTDAARIHQLDVARWEAEGRPGGPLGRPTETEAIDKANMIQAAMVAGRFASPSSFQIEVGDPDSQVPAQFFIDAARRIQAEEEDYDAAYDRFLQEYGDDAYVWWVATSENRTGVPATSEAFKRQEKFADLIQENPEVGLAIVGLDTQNGPFNYDVYALQEARGERARLAPDEVQAKAESEKGWREWSRLSTAIDAELAARGLTSVQQSGAEDLQILKRQYEAQLSQAYPGWRRDRDTFDRGKSYQIVNGLQRVLDSGEGPDPRLNPAWRGVADYLELHRAVAAELDARFLQGGSRDITTTQNSDLKYLWDMMVGQIVQDNPMFADLYHRMLDRHELTMGSGGLM